MIPRILLLATVLGLAALAAELILPRFPPHLGALRWLVYRIDDAGNYGLRPGTSYRFGGMFEKISPPVDWTVNEQGLRGLAPVGRADSRYRIATYGDSEAFGWAVEPDDTLQRRMEALDPRVEVVNFGVPGYNASSIARRIEETVPLFGPDHLLYLVNKNDVDAQRTISAPVLASNVLLRARFLYLAFVEKPWRKRARHSPERLSFMAGQLDRIANHADAYGLPVLVAFLEDDTWQGAREHADPGGFVDVATRQGGTKHRIVAVEAVVEVFPELDDHLSPDAYRALAARLCAEISGDPSGGCVPARWTPADRVHP